MLLTAKSTLLFVSFFCFFVSARAQFTKSIVLKPIYKEGWRYFYDTKKVNGPYSLQIPLQGVNNEEVNHYYNSFKSLQNLRGFSYLPALIFLFTNSNGHQHDAKTFLYLTLGGIAGDLTFNIISQSKMGKAIDIYNVCIAPRGSLNLQMEKIKTNQTLISFGFRQRF